MAVPWWMSEGLLFIRLCASERGHPCAVGGAGSLAVAAAVAEKVAAMDQVAMAKALVK